MREYIKKIQSKPEHIRKQILLGSLVVCMTIVVFIWVTTLVHISTKKETVKKDVGVKKEVVHPFALFGQTLKDTYNNLTASVGNISGTAEKEKIKVEEAKAEEKVIDLIPVEHNNQ